MIREIRIGSILSIGGIGGGNRMSGGGDGMSGRGDGMRVEEGME